MALPHLEEIAREPGGLGGLRAGVGRRLVFVHGFTQSARSWQRVLAHLPQRYELVLVDLPGHGSSSEVDAPDLEAAAALVGEVGGRATYVGYSLGGRTCLTLALQRPSLVEALVLIGATPGLKDPLERDARRAADEALAERLDPADHRGSSLEIFLAEWLAGPLFAHLDAEQADLASRRVNTTRGLAASLRHQGTGTQHPSHDRLAQLSMPVLCLAGEDDARFRTIASEMARAIGENAATAVVANTGHAAPFEDPAAFCSLLEDWLAHHR